MKNSNCKVIKIMRIRPKTFSVLSKTLPAAFLCVLLVPSEGCQRSETKTVPVKRGLLSPAERLSESTTVAAANASGFDLLRRLDSQAELGTGNIFISPFGILQAMTMVTNGAAGETKDEMLQALHLAGADLPGVNAEQKALRGLLSSTKKNSENTLLIANSLWVDTGAALAPQFVSVLDQFYGAPARTLDFADVDNAVGKINKWVDTNTNGKITALLTAGDLAGPAPIVLVNAVYFKAA